MTATTSVPEPTRTDSPEMARALRGLRLLEERGREIEMLSPDVYLVPSCSGRRRYRVDYASETCECPDFERRGDTCKHIYAVGISLDKRRRRSCAVCLGGLVFVGHLVEDSETGEEAEVLEAVACRRCASGLARF